MGEWGGDMGLSDVGDGSICLYMFILALQMACFCFFWLVGWHNTSVFLRGRGNIWLTVGSESNCLIGRGGQKNSS